MMSKQNTPPLLTKPQSSYKKLEKAMNEPVKEYEQIKKLLRIQPLHKYYHYILAQGAR